ncbi:putative zinc finger protein [Erysiphe neolycopersici]|uniref:Putative zinc finger protein n=1 Tax=Erysiphe neolycopersici TaxID=212602 RepID=A0A420HXW9_9PEZI|nr:putative zinc finger protein [Erysiphe neolycopersici]
MDLSKTGQISTRRSTPAKKFKCPYCETEFTRQHNLKSHLLTHSQEKPFTCHTCNMRFRRLHDLKRHTKLHTGERPHICLKCNRKFARGDALVRHTKGSGGCAGRRSSIGSLGADDDPEDSNKVECKKGAMDGVVYNKSADQLNENESTREKQQNFDFPNLPEENTNTSNCGDTYTSSKVISSYPPTEIQSIQPLRIPFYPTNDAESTGTRVSPHIMDTAIRGYTPGLKQPYKSSHNTRSNMTTPQNATTESSKPPSPNCLHSTQFFHEASSINRLKSPNQTLQSQSCSFVNQKSSQSTLLDFSLTSPDKTLPELRLPSLTSLAPHDQRYKLSNEAVSQKIHGNEQITSVMSPSSAEILSHTQIFNASQHQGTTNDRNNLFAGEKTVWSYVRILEVKVRHLTDKIEEMKTNEKTQQDKINSLLKEILLLKNNPNTISESYSTQ